MPERKDVLLGLKVAAGVGAAVTLWQLPKLLRLVSIARSKLELSERMGGSIVGAVLKAHGVPRIFTLPGGHVSPAVVSCESLGIDVIDVRNEADAVFAADATSRLTGTVGVAIVTAGPGVTNTVTAMKNAQMAHSPVLLIGGAAATVTKGRGSLQDIEQIGLFQSITKRCFTVGRVQDIAPTLREAMLVARSGVPGPVFVELPIDVMYSSLEISANMGLCGRKTASQLTDPAELSRVIVPVEEPRGTGGADYVARLAPSAPVFVQHTKPRFPFPVQQFLQFELKRLFGDAWRTADSVAPLPFVRAVPSAAQLDGLLALIRSAKKPVCIIGSQAVSGLPPAEMAAVGEAVRGLNAPCYLSGMARGVMGADHPFFLRQNRRDALKAADVVVLFGVSVDFRLDYGRSLSPKSKIVTINLSREELTRNTDAFWKPCMTVQADPSQVLLALGAKPFASTDVEWVAGMKAAEAAKEAANATAGSANAVGRGSMENKSLVNPVGFFCGLAELLAGRDDVIYVGDGGDFVGTAAYIVRPAAPGAWLDPGPYGTLGVGAGFALAAKLACPEKTVVLLWGDGSAGYSISEYDVFARHKAPVVAIVGNDACWSQIVRDQRAILGSEAACNLSYCRYDKIAVAYGADAAKEVYAASESKLDKALKAVKEALSAAKGGRAGCVNVLIGRSTFREGSISV